MCIVAKLLLVFFVFVTGFASAQNVTIKGVIRDDRNQILPQAHIILFPDSVFGITNSEGNFIIQSTKGDKRLQISFVGYELFDEMVTVLNDTALAITLQSQPRELEEIVITSTLDRHQEIFDGNQTSKYVLTQDDVNAIPVLGGEADVIKTLQLLPGTVRGIEGSSDLFVRGGAADQNLVLLDGATIYNTSHLFGFLSVFNADVLDRVEAINGGFPAQYGGRLSSILNVHTRSMIPEKTAVSGDIGLIASRLFVEQPIIKNKASFWIAGRRTYIDQVIRATGEELPYYFYDLNGKFLFKPTARDEFEFSHYSGDDILDLFRDRDGDGDGFLTTYSSGNSSQSLRWQRQHSNQWYSTLTLARTKYRYNIRNSFEENELLAHSDIEDYSARLYFEKDSLGRGTLRTGFDWIRHQVSPNIVNTAGTITEVLESSIARGRVANEFAVHLQYEWSPDERIQINPGIRISSSVVRNKNYLFPEPRLSVRYALNRNEALSSATRAWYNTCTAFRILRYHHPRISGTR